MTMNGTEIALSETLVLCKKFEGFRAKPYLCPAGVPTIGYGSTYYSDSRKVTLQDSAVTEEQATAMLREQVLKIYLPGAMSLCPKLSGYKLAAATDFAYNLGLTRLKTSTLRKRLNEGDWVAAEVELRKWTRGGGKILPGLVARRESEIALLRRAE